MAAPIKDSTKLLFFVFFIMSRNLAFTLLRQGSTGDEILQILNTISNGIVSEADYVDSDDELDYEPVDSEVEEYEPDAELVAL